MIMLIEQVLEMSKRERGHRLKESVMVNKLICVTLCQFEQYASIANNHKFVNNTQLR